MKKNDKQDSDLRWSVAQRLEFIEFQLVWKGHINRGDVANRFGVKVQQASADLALYEALAPDNLAYDRNAKRFVASEKFKPQLLRPLADRQLLQLAAISGGLVDRHDTWFDELPPVGVVPVPQQHVSTAVVRSLLEAVRTKSAVEIEYQSMTRPEATRRAIVPHALAHDGRRWHARAWCPRNRDFRDFVLARIDNVGAISPYEINVHADREWFDEIELVLAPNPALAEGARRSLAKEYGMARGRLRIRTRVALAFYMIQHLHLDLDLPVARQQLVLVNMPEYKEACEHARMTTQQAIAAMTVI